MKLIALALVSVALGCSTAPNDVLLGDMDPNSLAAGDNTQNHYQDPNTGQNGLTDPSQVAQQTQSAGSVEVVARLHSCSKITYASLGNILTGRGVDLTATDENSAGNLYTGGQSALGVASYSGRVPEMIIPSTAALSKQFDIMVAAAQEIQSGLQGGTLSTPACTGTQLIDSSGNFTQDGLTCLMGKPATANHLAIANDAVTEAVGQGLTQVQGQQLAISAILEAAHTCE
jgi:hypothetical protein